MTTKTKLVLVLVAGFAVIILCSIAGCGEVTTTDMPGDGAGGAAGSVELHGDGGAAGEMMKLDGSGTAGVGGAGGEGGVGGMGGAGGAPGAGGASGEGGAAGAGGSPTPCTPDACNTCVNGVKTPMADGASCGPADGTCDGVAPFGGQRSCVRENLECKAGACIRNQVNCCNVPCPVVGQKQLCTGNQGATSDPTVCTVCAVWP
jgi:hypothetical protein